MIMYSLTVKFHDILHGYLSGCEISMVMNSVHFITQNKPYHDLRWHLYGRKGT